MRRPLRARGVDALAAAGGDHAMQLAALQVDQPPRQAAVAVDPAAHVVGIDVPERLRAERARHRTAIVIGHPGGVEAETRARRGADAVAGTEAEQQRAGGEAIAVNDDALARGAHRGEGLKILSDLAAAVFRNAHCRGGWHRSGTQHRGAEQH